MNLDELQSVRDRERQTDKLQQLRETFYADAGEFIQKLRDQRDSAAERADDPYDAPEVKRLTDEIDTAEQTVEAIYEKRVGKIVKAASFAAADLPAESDGMTAEEQDLFETLVANIKENRQHVLDVLAGEAGGGESEDGTPTAEEPATSAIPDSPPHQQAAEASPGETPPDPDRQPPTPDDVGSDSAQADATTGPGHDTGVSDESVSAADVMGADTQPPGKPQSDGTQSSQSGQSPPGHQTEQEPELRNDGGTAAASVDGANDGTQDESAPPANSDSATTIDRETVRITEDVGDIFGLDEREYDLSEDDVVTLPTTNAAPLVERDAAERLE